jgi:putative N-acetylmannosamine-6-phosphate epimerase
MPIVHLLCVGRHDTQQLREGIRQDLLTVDTKTEIPVYGIVKKEWIQHRYGREMAFD